MIPARTRSTLTAVSGHTFAVAVLTLILSAVTAPAEEEPDTDRTLSPYFFVHSDDPAVDRLPLKSTSVEANVAGIIADVKVAQVYKNEGGKPLEATYVFPASTRAAVYGMKMTIGERTIVARIKEREEARRDYDQAKKDGRTASLLEQHRPNVFQMNLANILPGDAIRVELSYTEILMPTESIYEFVYPTVVGPRYSNRPESSSSDGWIENPYSRQGEKPSYSFDIGVNLAAGLPIQDARSSSHRVDIRYENPSLARIRLKPDEKHGGDRDFILAYRLAGSGTEAGLLLHKGDRENFFLLMMQPPRRVAAAEIPPREYIFIIDVSGSMHGYPLDVSKELLTDLIGSLRPKDRFNVLLFAGSSSLLSEESLPATAGNVQAALRLIDQQGGGGGTELLPALSRALSLKRFVGFSRTVVVATDGYVDVEPQAFDIIRQHLGEANLFPFGIGTSVNRHLIEGMARVGMGEPFVVTKPDEAREKAIEFRKYILSPVLTSVRLDFGDFEAYDVEPAAVPDLFAERPIMVIGKWRGNPKGRIRLTGVGARGDYEDTLDAGEATAQDGNSALRYLWARHRIAHLSDYNQLQPSDERIKEVTTLGMSYNLLTAYTSFVAIDSSARRQGQDFASVAQPLPLPEGVSDYAVGRYAAKSLSGRVAHEESLSQAPAPIFLNKQAGRASIEAVGGILQLAPEGITASGGRSKASIEPLLTNLIGQLNTACSPSATHPPTSGKIVLKIIVDSRGHVKKADIDSRKGLTKDLERCLLQQITRWSLPSSSGSSDTTILLPLLISNR